MTGIGSASDGAWRAVVDLGSVSTGLLLTDGRQRIRRSVDTHLGAGTLAANGDVVPDAIDADALEQLRAVLTDYRRIADERGAAIQAIGTSAARRATNRTELDTAVADTLGVPLRVVDGPTEATLTFTGARSGLSARAEPSHGRDVAGHDEPSRSLTDADADGHGDGDGDEVGPAGSAATVGPLVTIDVGGGSTEFAFAAGVTESAGAVGRPGDTGSWSAPIGGVLVTRAYLRGDPPRPEELSAALSVVELHLDDLRREVPALAAALVDPDALVVGLGGVVTVAAVEVGLLDDDPLNGHGDGPVHGLQLDRAAVEDVFRTLATESRADRAHNPGLPPSRVDDIVGGCVVLVETMRQFGLDAITVSQRGLADGALLESGASIGG